MVSRLRAAWERIWTGDIGHVSTPDAASARPLRQGPPTSTTFRPTPHETWQFTQHDIHLNGTPLDQIFQPTPPDVPLWTALVQGLIAYRDWIEDRGVVRGRRIRARIEHWQDVIGRALHKQYDTQMTGLALECDGEQVKVNNVNVTQLLACYQLKPTAKARQFLQGIQHKLCLLLERPRDTALSAQLGDRVRRLYHDMSTCLSGEALDPLCLPLPRQSVDRV